MPSPDFEPNNVDSLALRVFDQLHAKSTLYQEDDVSSFSYCFTDGINRVFVRCNNVEGNRFFFVQRRVYPSSGKKTNLQKIRVDEVAFTDTGDELSFGGRSYHEYMNSIGNKSKTRRNEVQYLRRLESEDDTHRATSPRQMIPLLFCFTRGEFDQITDYDKPMQGSEERINLL